MAAIDRPPPDRDRGRSAAPQIPDFAGDRPCGKVYLVGAGPGRPDYLTLRGRSLLARAEVVVHDALIDPALLELAPAHCLRKPAGKRGGRPSTAQADIDRWLVDYCQQGFQVVRLKSGDPFVFGRCTEEMQALAAAGCPFEVVPGISSALAAPLLAGIPLTDPVLSRGFAVVSAHEPDALDWETLAQLDTLVALMAGRSLPEVAARLMQQGRSPQTPVAVVRAAGQLDGQVWAGTLESIAIQTAGIRLSPAVAIVGEVVRLRDYLGDWGRTPLGFAAEGEPPAPDSGAETEAIANPGGQAASPGRVALEFGQRRTSVGETSAGPLGSETGAIGPADRSGNFPAAGRSLAGKTVLVTRAAGQAGSFARQLADCGARAVEMPALEIGPPSDWGPFDRALDRLPEFDWIVLSSANGVRALVERLQARDRDLRDLAGTRLAVVGTKTAEVLGQYGLRADFVPPDFVADSLAETFPEPVAGASVLIPRVESGGRDLLIKALVDRGAVVNAVPAYQSRCPAAIAPEARQVLEDRTADIVTFASSKTVRNFCQLVEATWGARDADPADDSPTARRDRETEALPDLANPSPRRSAIAVDRLQGVCIASIGPQTSETCRECLGRADVEAAEYTLDGLLAAIAAWCR